jgi:hypothetical protein
MEKRGGCYLSKTGGGYGPPSLEGAKLFHTPTDEKKRGKETPITITDSYIFPSDRTISYTADRTVSQFSPRFIVWEQAGIHGRNISLAGKGRNISLIANDGTTLSTVQTQDISGKLDRQAVYSSVWVTSTLFHEEDGDGRRLADTKMKAYRSSGKNVDMNSSIKIGTYSKTMAGSI